ncbi:unnamed protein product [Caenorhabditis brenneri]
MQVGEYELTITDVTFFVVLLVVLKKIIKWFFAGKIDQPVKYEVEPLEPQNMTIDEIQRMRQDEKRCLVVVNDKIYDMSSSQDLYDNNRDLFEAKQGCGAEWEPICARKYPFIGLVVKK